MKGLKLLLEKILKENFDNEYFVVEVITEFVCTLYFRKMIFTFDRIEFSSSGESLFLYLENKCCVCIPLKY